MFLNIFDNSASTGLKTFLNVIGNIGCIHLLFSVHTNQPEV